MNQLSTNPEKQAATKSAAPLFIYIGHDGAEGSERRSANRAAHVAYLEGLYADGRLVYGGPMRDESDCSIGAMLVFSAADLAEARKQVEADPYFQAGVYASYELRLFVKVFPRQ